MSPTPLPSIASEKFQRSGLHEEPNAVAAYDNILKAEAQAIQGGTEEDLINARVLGYSILEFYASRAVLGDKAFRMIIDDVMRSSQDREGGEDDHSFVFEVGRKYRGVIDACTFIIIDYFLCPPFDIPVYFKLASQSRSTPNSPHTNSFLPTSCLEM